MQKTNSFYFTSMLFVDVEYEERRTVDDADSNFGLFSMIVKLLLHYVL